MLASELLGKRRAVRICRVIQSVITMQTKVATHSSHTQKKNYLSFRASFLKAPFFQYVFKIELLYDWCMRHCFTENLIDKNLIFD